MLGCWSSSSFLIPSTSTLSFVAKLRKAHNGCDGVLDSDTCCATSATVHEMSGTLPRTQFCVKHVVLVWRMLTITQKPFGQYLTMLMGTVWQDAELE